MCVSSTSVSQNRFVLLLYFLLSLLLPIFPLISSAETKKELHFGAKWYERDIKKNKMLLRGNAWIEWGEKKIYANEIEIQQDTKQAKARGEIRFESPQIFGWADLAEVDVKQDKTFLEKATLILDSIVITGEKVWQHKREEFEIAEGTYSNCNTEKKRDKEIAECNLDWKIYAKRFTVTLEKYFHAYNAILWARGVPVFVTPYFFGPAKSKRQTGFLSYEMSSNSVLGFGVTLPFFVNLGSWHDLTIWPSYYSDLGSHLRTEYRYIYDNDHHGKITLFFLEKRYQDDPLNPFLVYPKQNRYLGLLGETGISLSNYYGLGGRAFLRQIFRYVTNPFYTIDFSQDFGTKLTDLGSLRSQLALTYPVEYGLFTVQAQYFQSLIVPKVDKESDQGAVVELPSVYFSSLPFSFWKGKFLHQWEFLFSNYYRDKTYDPIANDPSITKVDSISNPEFDGNDILRTGQRMVAEGRLHWNASFSSSIQWQPNFRYGVLGYRFIEPQESYYYRGYGEVEIPFSLYLSRRFLSSVQSFSQISHVVQPRLLYVQSLFQSNAPNHSFFHSLQDTRTVSSQFDARDLLFPKEYFRLELIQRFRKKNTAGKTQRFVLLQLSNQYNIKRSRFDPRYFNEIGPLELLVSVDLWKIFWQLQGLYQWQATNISGFPVLREHEFSSSLGYRSEEGDQISINSVWYKKVDEENNAGLVYLRLYKTFPWFFDLEGILEYSFLTGEQRGYSVAAYIARKPVSCWKIKLIGGKTVYDRVFFSAAFQFQFGESSQFPSF